MVLKVYIITMYATHVLFQVYGWSPDMWEAGDLADSGIPDKAQSAYQSDHVFVHCKGRVRSLFYSLDFYGCFGLEFQ